MNKLSIGFPFSMSGGGPSLFMKRVRESVHRQKLAKASYFLNPLTDVNIYSNIVRNLYNKPYIFRVDGIYFDKMQPSETNEKRNHPVFKGIDKASGIVFQSDFSYKLICRFYKQPTIPYTIINNGTDSSVFTPYGSDKREELGIKKKDLVFISSANWRAHKRLKDIVAVFIEYSKNTDKTCHLIILGQADKPEDIRHTGLHFVGNVKPEELPQWYRTANICLFFSWLDNCPNAVAEAISCGLPVVCTNQGGTKELVELTKGGIVAEADEQFSFEPTDLYHPPVPDYHKLLEAMHNIVNHYEYYVQKIDRKPIDIDYVASEYVGFIKTVLEFKN